MTKKKKPVINFVVDPQLKHSIWEEASRLKKTPSRWIRETLQVGLVLSEGEDTPDEYVITLTREEHQRLRREGIRVSCKPLG